MYDCFNLMIIILVSTTIYRNYKTTDALESKMCYRKNISMRFIQNLNTLNIYIVTRHNNSEGHSFCKLRNESPQDIPINQFWDYFAGFRYS